VNWIDGTPPPPTIGRIVLYTSKIDNGPGNNVVSPAMVVRTRATCVPEVFERWGAEPTTVVSASDPSVTHETTGRPDVAGLVALLPDDSTVDLVVHGLGKDYREYGVQFDHEGAPGTWRWPPRP
jgi:hypothetical protein